MPRMAPVVWAEASGNSPDSSIAGASGSAFARHTRLWSLPACGTYFCDPYTLWQKRGAENSNGRLRRWRPRGIDPDGLAHANC